LFSRRTPVQAKLNIGEPDNKYEKEADTIAAKVVQQINSSPQDNSVQTQEGKENSFQLQRSPHSNYKGRLKFPNFKDKCRWKNCKGRL
jgi:FtsZ-interacting cell division protein ZipA